MNGHVKLSYAEWLMNNMYVLKAFKFFMLTLMLLKTNTHLNGVLWHKGAKRVNFMTTNVTCYVISVCGVNLNRNFMSIPLKCF